MPACGKTLIATDLTIEFPENCYGQILSRSGLAYKYFIQVGGGVIDSDYRGNIKILLFNHSNQDFYVKKNSRIAQLVFQKIFQPKLEEVNFINSTVRGEAGFGSTGT